MFCVASSHYIVSLDYLECCQNDSVILNPNNVNRTTHSVSRSVVVPRHTLRTEVEEGDVRIPGPEMQIPLTAAESASGEEGVEGWRGGGYGGQGGVHHPERRQGLGDTLPLGEVLLQLFSFQTEQQQLSFPTQEFTGNRFNQCCILAFLCEKNNCVDFYVSRA